MLWKQILKQNFLHIPMPVQFLKNKSLTKRYNIRFSKFVCRTSKIRDDRISIYLIFELTNITNTIVPSCCSAMTNVRYENCTSIDCITNYRFRIRTKICERICSLIKMIIIAGERRRVNIFIDYRIIN